MKKMMMMAVALLGAGFPVHAQTSAKDSLKVINLQEVQVVSTRATAKTPVAFTNIGKAELKKVNFGQDIPYLLSMTPSTLTTSDAGSGIGYTTLRVRGTDGTRINITVNGIPMNDAESHNLFWVNMPDFSSSVKDMQVQRGAGTSTNGAGAFGASVNMQTEGASMKPYAEFNGSYGSFNTHKETVKVGTGLLNNHWTFDARLSNIGTDGYIDRASVNLNSYYLQGGYFAENTSVKLIAFTGKEKTYHAWGYATKAEMEEHGRRYNPCGEYTGDDNEKHYYADQTDNYLQKNYQLLFNHTFSTAWNLNVALHYTKGDGYYEEYKEDRSFGEYGLKPFTTDGKEISESDLVRQKKMDNKFGGGVFSLNYTNHRLTASLGGGINQYRGNNFGKVTWVKNYIGALSPDHEYYRNQSKKTDGNIYLKASYDLTGGLSAYADLQYRHIDYTIDGANDKYDWNKSALRPLAVDKKFDFFNPKVGLNWNINPNHRVYASFSVAQKEPTRNNYMDGDPDSYPKATWSKNRIKNFVENIPIYDGWNLLDVVSVSHKSTRIAFSPDFLLNNRFAFTYQGFEAALQSQFVGKQYMTNAEVEALTLDKYFVSNLNLAYTFKPRKVVKEVTMGVTVYNLFNEEYENNGWASSSYDKDVNHRIDSAGYAAQAGTNVMAHVSFRF